MKFKRNLIEDQLKLHPPLAQLYRDGSAQLPDTRMPEMATGVESITDFAQNRSEAFPRTELADAACSYLQKLNASPQSLDNARKLANKNTYAIVSGHQPSLFGGQLFLILKIAAAIRAAALANDADPENDYIPVFWNASEDHNTTEYLRTCFFDGAHDLKTVRVEDLPQGVAAEHLPAETLRGVLDEITGLLPQSEFLEPLKADLRASLQGSVGESFSRLMLNWFGKYGLVVIEPHILRRLEGYRSLLCSALGNNAELQQELDKASETIDQAGFKPQLPNGEENRTLLFYLAKDHTRQRILLSDNYYTTAEGSFKLDLPALQQKIRECPENFSPVAALRPVIQSALLPVVAYIAGGGELSYHFQLPEIFRKMQTPMPLLLPRPGATILKNALIKYFRKSRFSPEDILSERFDFLFIQEQGEGEFREVIRAFWNILTNVENSGRQLENALCDIGIQNINDWKKEKERFYERLEALNRRYMEQNPSLGKNARSTFNKFKKYLLPAEGYQDNSCWFIYFYCLFGTELSDTICKEIDPFTSLHHLFIPEFDD